MGTHDVGLRDLEIFLEFSQTEHMGQAAEALGTSVPSIQRAVRVLEVQLGIPLVERDGRRVRLLRAGRVLAEHASRVLRSRADAIEAALAASGRKQMTLRIGHMFSLGLSVVPGYIASVLAQEPGTRVQLRHGPTHALIAALLAGEIDAAFVAPCPNEPDLAVTPLFTEGVLLAVAADDPLASAASVELARLRDRAFIALPQGSGSRYDLVQACARAGFTPKITVEVGDMYTLEGAVGAGLGVSIVPRSMTGHTHPRVVRVPLAETIPTTREVGLVYPRNAPRHGALALLLSLAAQPVAKRSKSVVVSPR
jgi:DNA-binding transcriptional LysR family regulator